MGGVVAWVLVCGRLLDRSWAEKGGAVEEKEREHAWMCDDGELAVCLLDLEL